MVASATVCWGLPRDSDRINRIGMAAFPSALGIGLPEGSTLGEWEANVYAQYSVPVSATTGLANTIDAVFCKLYENANSYVVSVQLEN